MSGIENWQLLQRQSLPLIIKEKMSLQRIRNFYDKYSGNVYIAYSGGKDSEVLLYLLKKVYPNVKVVFVDNGMELQTRKHAIKKADIIMKPKKSAYSIWKEKGIPFPSKQQAHFLYQAKNTKSDYLRSRLMNGIMKDGSKTQFKISEKWKPVLDTNIKVSPACCEGLKKEPFRRYQKESGNKPFIGTMACDSNLRRHQYLKHGCINIEKESCTPLAFWTEQDILKFLIDNKIDYCDAYGYIFKNEDGILETKKAKRTGCTNCLFGIHLEKEPNRLQRLYKDNPKQHDIFVNKWVDGDVRKLLDLFNIKYM